MSVRVVRWDTGREHEIPEEALRWGPETKQGTCRAQLLRNSRLGSGGIVPLLGDAPYVLPFEGARWAVRVTLADRVQPAAAVAGWNTVRADEQSEAGGTRFRMLGGAVPSARLSRDLDRLFSLLEAAGDALRAEEQNRRPDALGEARELLANALSWVPKDHVPRLWERIRAFVERETSAEIRRAWKGGGRG